MLGLPPPPLFSLWQEWLGLWRRKVEEAWGGAAVVVAVLMMDQAMAWTWGVAVVGVVVVAVAVVEVRRGALMRGGGSHWPKGRLVPTAAPLHFTLPPSTSKDHRLGVLMVILPPTQP